MLTCEQVIGIRLFSAAWVTSWFPKCLERTGVFVQVQPERNPKKEKLSVLCFDSMFDT